MITALPGIVDAGVVAKAESEMLAVCPLAIVAVAALPSATLALFGLVKATVPPAPAPAVAGTQVVGPTPTEPLLAPL